MKAQSECSRVGWVIHSCKHLGHCIGQEPQSDILPHSIETAPSAMMWSQSPLRSCGNPGSPESKLARCALGSDGVTTDTVVSGTLWGSISYFGWESWQFGSFQISPITVAPDPQRLPVTLISGTRFLSG